MSPIWSSSASTILRGRSSAAGGRRYHRLGATQQNVHASDLQLLRRFPRGRHWTLVIVVHRVIGFQRQSGAAKIAAA
jgi:hypothetical protein